MAEQPHEVTTVYTHPDAKVDIVLVHGLNGDPRKTWTSPENKIFWPVDLLPDTLGLPPANIIVYGYNSKVFGYPSENPMLKHAQTLVVALDAHRQEHGTTRNPIIWIAHSLGGILIKRALLYSSGVNNTHRDHLRSIYVSTFAIVFLGTPHNGSSLASPAFALQKLSSALIPRAVFDSEPILLKTLQRDSEILKEISNQFLEIAHFFQIHMAYETIKTDLKVLRTLIVDSDSAYQPLANAVSYGIEATHSGMCKFSSNTAPGYQIMTNALRGWVQTAPSVIQVRWNSETEHRTHHLRQERDEALVVAAGLGIGRLGQSSNTTRVGGTTAAAEAEPRITSFGAGALTDPTATDMGNAVSSPIAIPLPKSPVSSLHSSLPTRESDVLINGRKPFYFVPPHFRQNSFFVGRDDELTQLHKLLNDPQRTAKGTSAVIIHSLVGGGKSHLAREYFFKHQEDYPGGVCWVQATSILEMEQFYWEIAMNGPYQELNAGNPPQENVDNLPDAVDMVCRWLRGRHHWLLVFDGISFNTPGIERFIPDAKNTSIIYTSTESSFSGDSRFDNPRMLRLKELLPQQARELLFLELDRTDSSAADDQTALDLVKALGCLPLMVHTAARHLKTTHEPLARYLQKLRDRCRIEPGKLLAYVAVHKELEERGKSQALNLMFLLAYFDSRIPVGFLDLGLQRSERAALAEYDKDHKTASLTNSLRTLIAFALLERTETEVVSPTSSQSSSRRETKRPSKSVDVLVIHTVVQLFFLGVLHERKQSKVWMKRAVDVYCHAFEEARLLLKINSQVGTLDDYRCFKIHGHKLMERVAANTNKKRSFYGGHEDLLSRIQRCIHQCDKAISRMSKAAQKHIVNNLQSSGPIEPDCNTVSVFEQVPSISDSEASSSTSVTTLTASAGSSPGSILYAPTFSEYGRAGVRVNDGDTPWRLATESVGTSTGSISHAATFSEYGRAGVRVYNGGIPFPWMPNDEPVSGSVDDVEESPICYQSPKPIASATFSSLLGPRPYDECLFGGPAGYAGGSSLIEDESDDMDDATTHTSTPQYPSLSPSGTEVYRSRPGSSASYPSAREQQPQPTERHHRTVDRQNNRRYHDSSGSWRQMGTADPRVCVDFASAERSVIGSRPGTSDGLRPNMNIKGKSTAESSLRAYSMLSLRPVQKAAASTSSAENSNLDVQPLFSTHASDSGTGISENEVDDGNFQEGRQKEPQPSVAKKEPTMADSLYSFCANTLKQLRNVLSFRSWTKPASEQPQRQDADRPASLVQVGSSSDAGKGSGLFIANQDVMKDPSKTARSCSGQGCDSTPQTPYPDIDTMPQFGSLQRPGPAAGYTLERAHSVIASSIRSWADETYQPGSRRLVSGNPMADSFPQPTPSGFPQPFMLRVESNLSLQQSHDAGGYSSQPVTPDPSVGAQPGRRRIPKRHPPVYAVTGGLQARPKRDSRRQRKAPPLSSGGRRAPIRALPALRRNSHTSLVETEPSPRRNDFFDIHTSYQFHEERRQSGLLVPGPGPEREEAAVSGSSAAMRPHRPEAEQSTAMQASAHMRRSGSGSGSRSGSSSGHRGTVNRAWQPAQRHSVAMSYSSNDSGSLEPESGSDYIENMAFGFVAAGAWTDRDTSSDARHYPMQIANIDGAEYAAQPMFRGGSGSGYRARWGKQPRDEAH